MKLIFFLLLFTASIMLPDSVHADTTYRSIKVEMINGTSLLINGEKNSSVKMVITEDDMRLFSIPENQILIPLEKLKKITFSEEEGELSLSEVKEISSDSIKLSYCGDDLIIDNLPAGSQISLISMAGTIVHKAVADGSHVIRLTSFTSGVYVICINNNTYKICISR